MALASCRECGSKVSTEAETCPQCGVPNPTRVAAAAAQPPVTDRGDYASPQNMTRQETPVYRASVHWVIYARTLLVLALAVGSTFIHDYLAIAMVVATVGVGIASFIARRSTEFVITTRRVIAKRGVVRRRTVETLLEKVEAVSIDQSLLGRILNYGNVTVQGTGGTEESFTLVSDPMALRKTIHEQIDAVRPAGSVYVAPR